MTAESASVDVSPNDSNAPSAILRKILLMTAAGGLTDRDVQRALALDLGGTADLGDCLFGSTGW